MITKVNLYLIGYPIGPIFGPCASPPRIRSNNVTLIMAIYRPRTTYLIIRKVAQLFIPAS